MSTLKTSEEKLDYLKNLENIKANLRQELLKHTKEDIGLWYIDLDNNSFTCTKQISYLFNLEVKNNAIKWAKGHYLMYTKLRKESTKNYLRSTA